MLDGTQGTDLNLQTNTTLVLVDVYLAHTTFVIWCHLHVWYSSVLCLLFDAIENKNQASCTLGHEVDSTACSIVHEARNATGTGIFSCLIISACTTHRLGITLSNTWLLVQHTG